MLRKAKRTFLEGVNRWLFTGLLIIAITAIVNFCIPKAPAALYVILYGLGTFLLVIYMILSLARKEKKPEKQEKSVPPHGIRKRENKVAKTIHIL